MMKPIVIIPCCGESQRYNGAKKQFLILPNGLPLPIFSASGIKFYERKIYAFIGEEFVENYADRWNTWDGELCLLPKQTESQVHTVQQVIYSHALHNKPIFIKDCDNYFDVAASADSIIVRHIQNAAFKLHNKSYTVVGEKGYATRIAERQQISMYANVGGYGFRSGGEFLEHSNGKKYISEVITEAIAAGKRFDVRRCENYIDYGEQDDYNLFIRNYFSYVPPAEEAQ